MTPARTQALTAASTTALSTIQSRIQSTRPAVLNVDWRKVGGLTFVKVGRLTLSFSVARTYRPIGA